MQNLAEKQTYLEIHRQKYAKYYAPGILEVESHYPLVERLEDFAAQANVPSYYVYNTRMADYCSKEEIDYARKFRSWTSQNVAGLLYMGSLQSVEDRMLAMAGALLRNYIQVRVLTMQSLVAALRELDPVDETMVMVPNFFLYSGSGSSMPEWQAAMLSDWLIGRFTKGKQTAVYVSDLDGCMERLGGMVMNHFRSHYLTVQK
jgi:hypothetical protein